MRPVLRPAEPSASPPPPTLLPPYRDMQQPSVTPSDGLATYEIVIIACVVGGVICAIVGAMFMLR